MSIKLQPPPGVKRSKVSMYYALKAIAKRKGNRKAYLALDKKIKAYERKSKGR